MIFLYMSAFTERVVLTIHSIYYLVLYHITIGHCVYLMIICTVESQYKFVLMINCMAISIICKCCARFMLTYSMSTRNWHWPKNMLLLKIHNFTQSVWKHILTKFHIDCVKIVDFLIKAYFWGQCQFRFDIL